MTGCISPSLPSSYELAKDSRLDFEEDLHLKRTCRAFFEKYSANPFVQMVAKMVESDLFILERKNITHPFIAFPSKQALEIHAQYYQAKYGFLIRFATCETISSLLEKIRLDQREPAYVSFIVAEDEENLERGHVLPLLCSFGSRSIEFLIMDVLGKDEDGEEGFVTELFDKLCQFTSRENILIAIGDRQEDQFSCRTGALTLLRNGNLSLKYHGFSEGVKTPLQKLVGEPNDPLCTALPAEWTYGEQLSTVTKTQVAIRDCFSSHTSKREHPRTVDSFRKAYTEPVVLMCSLRNSEDYTSFFRGLVPPPEVEATVSKEGFELKFQVESIENTYLLRKGFRRAIAAKTLS